MWNDDDDSMFVAMFVLGVIMGVVTAGVIFVIYGA